jgi:hypothetical protein
MLAPGGGRGAVIPAVGAPPRGGGVTNGPGAGINGAPAPMPPIAGEPGVVWPSVAPQLRQNFMPAGFSPRQAPQITGNPAPPGEVCVGGGAIAVPQFKQNDDPGGLWWPQAEQRSID